MSATATAPQKKPAVTPHTPQNAAEKPENGVPVAAKPAPGPVSTTPTVDDEELRKEAAALEEEEAGVEEGESAESEPEEEEEVEEDAVSNRLFGAVKEITDEIEECDRIIEKAESEYKTKLEQAEAEHQARLEQIESEHTSVVEKTEARREEVKVQFQNALNKMQSTYGVAPVKAMQRRTAPKARQSSNGRHEKSIRALILEYLEKHRQARTSEIRGFLQKQGRTTNPGVELSRMVKDGSIVNKERGMYTMGKPRK